MLEYVPFYCQFHFTQENLLPTRRPPHLTRECGGQNPSSQPTGSRHTRTKGYETTTVSIQANSRPQQRTTPCGPRSSCTASPGCQTRHPTATDPTFRKSAHATRQPHAHIQLRPARRTRPIRPPSTQVCSAGFAATIELFK